MSISYECISSPICQSHELLRTVNEAGAALGVTPGSQGEASTLRNVLEVYFIEHMVFVEVNCRLHVIFNFNAETSEEMSSFSCSPWLYGN